MYGSLCAEFYDLAKGYAPQDEVSFYVDILKNRKLVLGAMCGSGRIIFPLFREGVNIQGVDNSPYMLDNFKKRANAANIKPVLYLDSIETMQLPESYDAILVPLASFQLMYPENRAHQALLNLKQHIVKGGILILDLFVPWEALSSKANDFWGEREVVAANGTIIKCKTHDKLNKVENYILRHNTYTKILDDNIIEIEEEEYIVRWYYQAEMEELLKKFGFSGITVYEKFINTSNHMVFVGTNE